MPSRLTSRDSLLRSVSLDVGVELSADIVLVEAVVRQLVMVLRATLACIHFSPTLHFSHCFLGQGLTGESVAFLDRPVGVVDGIFEPEIEVAIVDDRSSG